MRPLLLLLSFAFIGQCKQGYHGLREADLSLGLRLGEHRYFNNEDLCVDGGGERNLAGCGCGNA